MPYDQNNPAGRLEQRVADLLQDSLGGTWLPVTKRSKPYPNTGEKFWGSPLLVAAVAGAVFALLFCVLPWLAPLPTPHLLWLSVYGAGWLAWATLTARVTSASIFETIKYGIIPGLSAKTAEAIDHDLVGQFDNNILLARAWAVAVVGAFAAGVAVYFDVHRKAHFLEILWWSCGWATLFVVAAKVMMTARFYHVFAAHLKDDSVKLYALAPAESVLVKNVASVGQRVLLFWFGIAVSIGLVLPFSVDDFTQTPHTLSEWIAAVKNNWFVLIVVPVTTFFSIGVGTTIFLRSEQAIRRAVNRIGHATLRSTESEAADLFNRRQEFDEAGWKKLREIETLRKGLATAGSYRSFLVSGLSVLVPFVPAIVSAIVHLAGLSSANSVKFFE